MESDKDLHERIKNSTIDAPRIGITSADITATTVVGSFDPVQDLEDFHWKFGLQYLGPPRALTGELGEFRQKFLLEEAEEYSQSREELEEDLKEGTRTDIVAALLADQLDALVDLVYVAIGTAYLHGFDFREAWRRVHEKNMQKKRAEKSTDSKRGTTFDVVKPDGWTPPCHWDLVRDHAHQNHIGDHPNPSEFSEKET